jgi:hypothetical protein
VTRRAPCEQIRPLRELKGRRDRAWLAAALAAVRETAARPEGNESTLMVPIKDAVERYATPSRCATRVQSLQIMGGYVGTYSCWLTGAL